MSRHLVALVLLLVVPLAAANSLSGTSAGFQRNGAGFQVWDVYELQVVRSGWVDLEWRSGPLAALNFRPIYHLQLYMRGSFDDGVLSDHEILAHGWEVRAMLETVSIGYAPGRYPVAVIPRTSFADGYTLSSDAGGLILTDQIVVPICAVKDPCR